MYDIILCLFLLFFVILMTLLHTYLLLWTYTMKQDDVKVNVDKEFQTPYSLYDIQLIL